MTPGDRVSQLYPQALGTHFSRLLRHYGLQWDCSLIPATTQDWTSGCETDHSSTEAMNE
jgi:hypothetical protein